jgi:hypothetical protein
VSGLGWEVERQHSNAPREEGLLLGPAAITTGGGFIFVAHDTTGG